MTELKTIGLTMLIIFGLRVFIILGYLLQYRKLSWFDRVEEFGKTKPGKIIYHNYLTALLIALSFIGALIYVQFDAKRSLTLYKKLTLGMVTNSTCAGKTGCNFSVKFYDLKGNEYFTSTYITSQEVGLIYEGQLFNVEYSYENPDYSKIILEQPIIPQNDTIIERLAKVLEVNKNENSTLSIFYWFHYKSRPYHGVRFAPINTKINVGDEYYVEFPRKRPELGVLNLKKKLNIEKLRKLNRNANIDSLVEKDRDYKFKPDWIK
jgi:hypothetical protein